MILEIIIFSWVTTSLRNQIFSSVIKHLIKERGSRHNEVVMSCTHIQKSPLVTNLANRVISFIVTHINIFCYTCSYIAISCLFFLLTFLRRLHLFWAKALSNSLSNPQSWEIRLAYILSSPSADITCGITLGTLLMSLIKFYHLI